MRNPEGMTLREIRNEDRSLTSRIKILPLLFLVYLQAFDLFAMEKSWIGTIDPENNPNTPIGALDAGNELTSVLISRPEYTLSWNQKTRLLNWASWVLVDGDIGKTGRSGFRRDDELERFLEGQNSSAVDTYEYDGTCLDRGHQG